MTPALVVLVRGPEEVEAALLGGATLIETRDAAEVVAIRQALRGRGEVLLRATVATEVLATGADRIALPVTGSGAVPAPSGQRPIAVIDACGDGAEGLIPCLAKAGYAEVRIDLGEGQGIVSRIGLPKLRRLSDAARSSGLGLSFAGALEAPDVPRLRVLKPDAFVFDHAIRRAGRIDPEIVGEIAELLRANAPPAEGPCDRIFVRDLMVEMEIGAYGHERGRRQRVRFDVEVEVPRATGATGMGAIYSYDLITDAVAMLAASAHVDFVETLAEELAAMVLGDSRVRSVMVRVEKLDLGPGGVGIEIRRE